MVPRPSASRIAKNLAFPAAPNPRRASTPLTRDLTIALSTAATGFLLLALVGPSSAAAQTLDHFTCYRTATAKHTPKFQSVSTVQVVDQFRASDVDVKKPKFICTPTNKSNEDPSAPSHPDHLLE